MEEIKSAGDAEFRGCGCGCGCPPNNKDFNKSSANTSAKQDGNKCKCICTSDYSDNHYDNARTGK